MFAQNVRSHESPDAFAVRLIRCAVDVCRVAVDHHLVPLAIFGPTDDPNWKFPIFEIFP